MQISEKYRRPSVQRKTTPLPRRARYDWITAGWKDLITSYTSALWNLNVDFGSR
jgi:hypothetical protein